MPGKMIEERQCVRLAATELRGEVEHRARLGALTGEAADHFGSERGQILGEIRSRKEAFGVAVIKRGVACAHLIKVDGELRRIKGFAFAQILAWSDNFVPRF